jgi:predicted metal-dependent hydrolase
MVEEEALVQQPANGAQKDLNTTINKIYYRKMTTKWASHSQNKNLTINSLLKYLPGDLINYIIYHETAHNIERNHNDGFWALVSKRFPDYVGKEKSLLTYWFLIQKP